MWNDKVNKMTILMTLMLALLLKFYSNNPDLKNYTEKEWNIVLVLFNLNGESNRSSILLGNIKFL